MPSWSNYPYGCREVRVKNGSAASVANRAAQTLKFKEVLSSAQLMGNDRVVAAKSFLTHMELEFEAGGMDLDFYAALTGRTLATTGTGTAEVSTMTVAGGSSYPYVTLYGRMLGETTDDLHVKFFKAQIVEIDGEFKEGAFAVNKCKLIAIPDSAFSEKVAEIIANETASAIKVYTGEVNGVATYE